MIDPLPSSVGWSLVLMGVLLVILVVLAVVATRMQHETLDDPQENVFDGKSRPGDGD